MQTGYCGNVHPGKTIEEVKKNLAAHTLDVKSQVRPDKQMNVGLWLSASAARELDDRDCLQEFGDWLAQRDLLPYTLNGFPYGDFHQEIVKLEVYKPTWAEPERLDYTVRLAKILDAILPPNVDGTISTLPLGWPMAGNKSVVEDDQFWKSCADNLKRCARSLDQIEQDTGRNIFVCIEPEPGCILDTWDDVVGFFDQHLLTGEDADLIRKHIGVCHDVCHSAVMFEEQATAISEYKKAGIKIGKVQVSSAVAVDFESGTPDEIPSKLQQLRSFAEPRYLHQTSVRVDDKTLFYQDLYDALESHPEPRGQWRVHFHVPIFSPSFGPIGTSQSEIIKCVQAIEDTGEPLPHFEVETYAWNVLPESLKEAKLADGIAKEIAWFDKLMATNSQS